MGWVVGEAGQMGAVIYRRKEQGIWLCLSVDGCVSVCGRLCFCLWPSMFLPSRVFFFFVAVFETVSVSVCSRLCVLSGRLCVCLWSVLLLEGRARIWDGVAAVSSFQGSWKTEIFAGYFTWKARDVKVRLFARGEDDGERKMDEHCRDCEKKKRKSRYFIIFPRSILCNFESLEVVKVGFIGPGRTPDTSHHIFMGVAYW